MTTPPPPRRPSGEILRELRETIFDLDQAQLARKLGIHPDHLSRIENGRNDYRVMPRHLASLVQLKPPVDLEEGHDRLIEELKATVHAEEAEQKAGRRAARQNNSGKVPSAPAAPQPTHVTPAPTTQQTHAAPAPTPQPTSAVLRAVVGWGALAAAFALLAGTGLVALRTLSTFAGTADRQRELTEQQLQTADTQRQAAEKQLEAAEKQRQMADAQFQATRELLASARIPLSAQLVAAMPPPVPGAAIVTIKTGLKMPEKPDPAWLKPASDGVCRNPWTGEQIVAAVYRHACWQVVAKLTPGRPCPSDIYDPPPEAIPRHRDLCFIPWSVKEEPHRSVTP